VGNYKLQNHLTTKIDFIVTVSFIGTCELQEIQCQKLSLQVGLFFHHNFD